MCTQWSCRVSSLTITFKQCTLQTANSREKWMVSIEFERIASVLHMKTDYFDFNWLTDLCSFVVKHFHKISRDFRFKRSLCTKIVNMYWFSEECCSFVVKYVRRPSYLRDSHFKWLPCTKINNWKNRLLLIGLLILFTSCEACRPAITYVRVMHASAGLP